MQKNMFEDSIIKESVRNLIRNTVTSHFKADPDERLRAFTLPGTSFSLEMDLVSDFRGKIDFIGVEENPIVFNEAMKKLCDLPSNLYSRVGLWNDNDLDYWKKSIPSSSHAFSFIWLDYCGSWGPSREKAIDLIFKNKHLDFHRGEPLIAMTLCAARESKVSTELLLDSVKLDRLLKGRSLDDEEAASEARRIGVPIALNKVARKYGYSLIPQFTVHYCDKVRSKRAAPMLLFMFKVVKGKASYKKGKVPHAEMRAWLSESIH